ncbi:hypothetical protein GQ53DRAFT_886015 [Thozetella sp. PMI_491]|nr:hypothetical protein GQ53DRAFT_886015 [Thozetella sp. PMI_491]
MSIKKVHEIVVLGGNLAGLGATQFFLRHTIPSLQRLNKSNAIHITLVTPNTHMFFKPASPRALIQPSLLPESKLWRPLSEALQQYPADQVTHLQAVATSLDPAKRTVTIAPKSSGGIASAEKTIVYDSLLIATGTTSRSPLWTLHDDQDLTLQAWKSLRTALKDAKTILIAGGGPVGVEVAGEIASAFPSAEITIISGGPQLLQRVKPETGARAQHYLESHFHSIKVLHGISITGSPTAGADPNTTTIRLSDGTSRTVDLFIDATGGMPNSQFIPDDWLDPTKRVVRSDVYYRVRGNGTDDVTGVYAVGDVVSESANSLMELHAMVPTICTAIGADIAAKLGLGVPKPAGFLQSLSDALFGGDVLHPKEYKPMKDTIMVPMGPAGGVGQLFGWKTPSWFVKWVKGNAFLTEMIDPIMSGTRFNP